MCSIVRILVLACVLALDFLALLLMTMLATNAILARAHMLYPLQIVGRYNGHWGICLAPTPHPTPHPQCRSSHVTWQISWQVPHYSWPVKTVHKEFSLILCFIFKLTIIGLLKQDHLRMIQAAWRQELQAIITLTHLYTAQAWSWNLHALLPFHFNN